MQKNIFIFDQNKCVGCHACVVACMNENGFQQPNPWRNVPQSQDTHFPELPLFHLSLACNNCDDAPCLKNCPASAYSRDEKTGAIIHHPEKCIGCKYCTWACPYDAPKFNPKTGLVEKCTFCNHRIEENLKPACANHCPVGALDFSYKEFTREESQNSTPVPVDVGSKIEIKKVRNTTGPEIDLNIFKDQPKEINPTKKHQKISATEEWPLLIFTLLCSVLVGLFASNKTETFSIINKIMYLGTGAIAAILSMIHLGKKQRAWRSVLNMKNSWLSREILTFSVFFGAVFIDYFIFNIPNIIITLLGISLLIAIDMLYYLATWRWPIKIHSAQTVFIGITLFALFSENIYLLAVIIAFRLTIYIYRKYAILNIGFISIIRVLLPLLALSLILANQSVVIVFSLVGFGEIIDRVEFYNELNVPDPKIEFAK